MSTYPVGLPIGSAWVEAPATAPVYFPYDGSLVGQAPVGTADLARRALDHAVEVRDQVGRLPSHVRRAALQGALSAVSERRSEFIDLLVLETGKPIVDCRIELDRSLLTLQTAAEEVARLHGETVPLDLLPSGDGLLGFWVRKPIGVVVGITGFNYPLLLASHKIAPALAAGCPIIVKPAPQTPLATLWLVHLVREALTAAGGPAEAVQLVTGGADVGSTLTTDPRIGAVSFTGSAAVGHQIAKAAAPTKVLLELGSNSALVVAEDADLDAAADAIVRGGYYASGQACISVQRVIAVDPIRAHLLEKVQQRLSSVVVGDPRDEQTRVSALIDHRSTERVRTWINEALTAGATLAYPPTTPAVPARSSTAAVPPTSSSAAVPATSSTAAVPATSSSAAVPATSSTAAVPATSSTAAVPATSSTAAVPATSSTAADTATTSSTAVPAATSTTSAIDPSPDHLGPTVLVDVPDGQLAWDEEIFGPVIAIRSVPDIAAAFRTVNESRYGLHASVFTASLETAFAAIDQLDVGGVVVNELPGFRSDVMPYGGVKDSGTGREGPRFAIDELTTTRMAIIRPNTKRGDE